MYSLGLLATATIPSKLYKGHSPLYNFAKNKLYYCSAARDRGKGSPSRLSGKKKELTMKYPKELSKSERADYAAWLRWSKRNARAALNERVAKLNHGDGKASN